jgi:hypothetical protein
VAPVAPAQAGATPAFTGVNFTLLAVAIALATLGLLLVVLASRDAAAASRSDTA